MPRKRKNENDTGGFQPIEVTVGQTTPPLVREVTFGQPEEQPKPKPQAAADKKKES